MRNRCSKWGGAAVLLAIACVAPGNAAATQPGGATAHDSCGPAGGLHFICGPVASEDLARVPRTHWLIASGLNTGSPAHLYLVDARTKRGRPIFPIGNPAMRADPTVSRDCPGPPDLSNMSTDGINIRTGRNGQHLLFAANHGDRRAIEMFRITSGRGAPSLVWIGCAVMPAGTLPNAVVPVAGGRLLVTSFHDPDDPDAWQRMERGEPTGSLWEWSPRAGFQRLDIGPVSGANGLETSADGRVIYVSAWSSGRLLLFDRDTGERREIALDFLPDNIKRSADGTLIVGGQRTSVAAIAACQGPACPQPWVVARVDPGTGSVITLLAGRGDGRINYACTGLEVDGTLFVTARGDRRLAYVRPADTPPAAPLTRKPRRPIRTSSWR